MFEIKRSTLVLVLYMNPSYFLDYTNELNLFKDKLKCLQVIKQILTNDLRNEVILKAIDLRFVILTWIIALEISQWTEQDL